MLRSLLSILGLLDSPSDGMYTLNGRPVQELTHSERARVRNREIGFIFQAFNLIGDLTVYDGACRRSWREFFTRKEPKTKKAYAADNINDLPPLRGALTRVIDIDLASAKTQRSRS